MLSFFCSDSESKSSTKYSLESSESIRYIFVQKCQAILQIVFMLQWMSSVTFGILTSTVVHKIRYKLAAKVLNHEVLGCYKC